MTRLTRSALVLCPLLFILVALAAGAGSTVAGATGGAPLLSDGGPTMASTTTHVIYWLPSGQTYEPSGSDTRFQTLTRQFLSDVGGTSFYNIVTQYPDGSGHTPTNSSTFGGWVIDQEAYPQTGTITAPLGDSDLQLEVLSVATASGWSLDATTFITVYTGYGIHVCLNAPGGQCSNDTFCAYHSWFVPPGGSQPIVYAVVPDPANDTGTCLANGSTDASYPNGDAIADSAISLTSKELFGAVTDPQGNGWADATQAEIGDKCDWDFGTIASNGSNVTLAHGDAYLVQREWSNDAGGCSLSYTPLLRGTRQTPTPPPAGTATPTPVPIPGQATRLTPTPVPAGTATPVPTPVPGRGHRPSPFS